MEETYLEETCLVPAKLPSLYHVYRARLWIGWVHEEQEVWWARTVLPNNPGETLQVPGGPWRTPKAAATALSAAVC